jgi:hypothetical protein
MKTKTLYEAERLAFTVSYDKWSISFLPQAELYLNDKNGVYDDCGFLELKWLMFGFAITFYGKKWRWTK